MTAPIDRHTIARITAAAPTAFSAALESTLHRALANANQRKYATLEHFLLAPIDDVDASAVMKACKVDLGALNERLTRCIDNDLKELVITNGGSRPTAGSQRVIQRAVIHVRSSGREEAAGQCLIPTIWILDCAV